MQTSQQGLVGRVISGVCRLVLWVSTVVIFGILTVNTILRYATGSSLKWANEVPELLFPWLVMAGVVLAAQQNAHIATTFLMDAVPARMQRIVASVAWLIVAVLYCVLSWATFQMLEIVHDEKSPILQLPGSITYACLMAGMLMLAILALQSAREVWREPTAKTEQAEPDAPSAYW